MDKETLQQLLSEAEERYAEAEAEFEDTDCCDDMHAMDTWESVIHWLNRKMKEIK